LFYILYPGYLQCIDSETMSLVEQYSLQIQTLSLSQTIQPVPATGAVPEGCAVAIASDRCTVHLMLKVRGQFYRFQPHIILCCDWLTVYESSDDCAKPDIFIP
jgi:hypothetical protein